MALERIGVQESWLFLKLKNSPCPKQEIMQKQQEVCTDEQNSDAGRKHTRDGNKDR